MEMIEAFLDTSVLLGKILNNSKKADEVFKNPNIKKYTNEYAIKEVYHVLKKLGFSEIHISYAIDYIREKCIILPTPKKEEFLDIMLKDKADRPIVCSAKKYNLVLYIDDEKTYLDAKKYVEVERVCKVN